MGLRLGAFDRASGRDRIAHNIVDRCEGFVLGLAVQDAEENRILDSDPGYRDALHLDLSLPGHAPVTAMGLDAATFRFPIPDLRRRLDLRLSLVGRPQQAGVAADAQGQFRLQVINRGEQAIRTEIEIFGAPVRLQLASVSVLPIKLEAGETYEQLLSYRTVPPHNRELFLCARERRRGAAAAFVQAEVQVRHNLPRLTQAGAALAGLTPLLFRDDAGQVVARVRFAMMDGELAIHAEVDDARVTAGSTPWRSHADPWQGPLFGLFFDQPSIDCVRQLVFFPSGPAGDELWYLRGPKRQPTPPLKWRVEAIHPARYELSARIPLAAIGLEADIPVFRLQAMVHVPGSRILPLFGSITAYNDSMRFALFMVEC